MHVMGTGTIGEPLIGLLARHKDKFGIDEVTFRKHTPVRADRPKVNQMLSRGALLAVDDDKMSEFESIGLKPSLTTEEAIDRATVIVDCTPSGVGLANKERYYNKYKGSDKGFIAQGSELGFGKMYARGIIELTDDDQFVHVVSCNTHNIAVLMKSLENQCSSVIPGGIISGDFVCLRRANDISQDSGFVPSTTVGEHEDSKYGTHHARDAYLLMKEQFPHTSMFSSAVKLNTQYMHSIRFSIHVDHIGTERASIEGVLSRFERNPYVAITEKTTSNKVFSFGRDHGLYGRILSQTVIAKSTLSVRHVYNGHIITGFCFTPQDGNSLLSSISATLHFLDPKKVEERLAWYTPYIFQEI